VNGKKDKKPLLAMLLIKFVHVSDKSNERNAISKQTLK